MINIYDGNNVMYRAAMTPSMPGQRRMTLRRRFEETMLRPVGTEIWCWDGRQHNERRREIYAPYKMNRVPKPEDVNSQIRLWRDVLRHTPAIQIEVHGWEADDVVGTLVRKMPGKARVHTNDMDYGQVAHLCELEGVNMKGVPPRWVTLFKAMNGDSSDNIDGIPNFGPKRWLEMEDHWPQIERAIIAGDPAGFMGLPFKPGVRAWLAVQENVELLQAMLTVTHFENVPDDELDGGIMVGEPNRLLGHQKLTEFFL